MKSQRLQLQSNDSFSNDDSKCIKVSNKQSKRNNSSTKYLSGAEYSPIKSAESVTAVQTKSSICNLNNNQQKIIAEKSLTEKTINLTNLVEETKPTIKTTGNNYKPTKDEVVKDFKGLERKCRKLKMCMGSLLDSGYLHQASGIVTYIHQYKDIGYIQMDDGKYVRFHKIDFKKQFYLMTVLFALKARFSFIQSTEPAKDGRKESRELVLIDFAYLSELKKCIGHQGINISNYWQILEYSEDLPLLMKQQQESKLYKSSSQ